jgi:Ser/Thr protein kinase RdoA (MazF antagonist)
VSRVASAHVRYRTQLEALAGSDVVLPAIEAAGERWGWDERRTWSRLHERFEPDAEPYATCVLATTDPPQWIVRLDAFRDAPPEPVRGTCVVRAGVAGRLHVTRFPADRGLATLPRVLMAAAEWTVVRYHPGRRCTVRVDGNGRSRFAKVYADGAVARIHADGLELWRAAQRGELGFRVAKPERFDAALRVVWQESVAGEPLTSRLYGRPGEELARRLGRAAGSLSRSGICPRRCRDRRWEFARSTVRCAELERRVPRLGESASRLLRQLEAAYASFDESELRPVHGALHTSQWLERSDSLALLDYDSLALGDPELDVATFLADVDVQNRRRVPVDRLNEAFLSGFESTAGVLDGRGLAAYRAQRRLEKALRVARAIRPDGDEKAGRRLRRALEALGEAA